MNKAFIQRPTDKYKLVGPSHLAYEGLYLLGYETIWFDIDELEDLPLSKNTLVVGYISTYLRALEKVGAGKLTNIDYPQELSKWFGRDIRESTLGTIRNNELLWPIFIKPIKDHKAFTGRVVSRFRDLISSSTLPNQFEVWACQPINFISEYRCFVLNKEIIGVRPYKGNPLVFPNREDISEMVLAWAESPAAYCLDVGVVSTGETLLVEVNDAHSAGHYGLDPLFYARFLEARWCELTGASPIS